MRIKQSEKYEGDDWWTWAVWIDGSEQELDQITTVTYTLHPTFREPVRKVTDRGSKFRLETEGWGVFTLYARVKLKNGTARQLKHALKLNYPGGKQTSA